MTRILIPRSDNLSAKVIEASDWEKYFKDVIRDYIICGFTITTQSPNVLAVNISTGSARLKGLYIEGTTSDSVTCLTACSTNYIYATLCRDPSCEPQAWVFAKNTTGVTPACSMVLGTATTNSSTVTSINQTVDNSYCGNGVEGLFRTASSSGEWFFGNGADGNSTITTNTTITQVKYYNDLTITNGAVVDFNYQPALMYVRGTLNICNGTLSVSGLGSAGGSGGTTNGGNGGQGEGPGYNATQGQPGQAGAAGQAGTGGAGGGSGGNGGALVTGGKAGNGGSGGNIPFTYGGGGTGPSSSGGGSGSGGSAGTLPREFNSIFDYLSKDTRQTAAGGGGGGGGAGASGGGGGGGARMYSGAGGPGGKGGPSYGGAGGAGGGTLVILANNIIIGTCGVLTSNGDPGGAGVASNGSPGYQGSPYVNAGGGGGGGASGGVGGGGGGGGGALVLIYKSLTNNGSYQAAGGAGGNGSTSGGTGGPGGSGGSPWPGGAGQAGTSSPSSNNGQPGGTGLLVTNKIT